MSACVADPALLDVLAEYKPGYVLMHSQGSPREMQVNPRYGNVVEEILAFFEEHLARLVKAGLPEDRIVLDPGIGFGKNKDHTVAILKGLERFASLGRPLYVGLSRKSMFREILGLELEQRPKPPVWLSRCWPRGASLTIAFTTLPVARKRCGLSKL